MTLLEAIDIRRSRRQYDGKPIEDHIINALSELACEYTNQGIRIEFVWNDGTAFNGFRKSYGMFKGVTHYAALIAEKDSPLHIEKLGYYGEMIVLHATVKGLGTCWVGGTFHRRSCPISLADHEKLYCVISIGYTDANESQREKLIRKITHHQTKTAADMYKSDSIVPDWFMSGMRAVEKAPSAMNRQPVIFEYQNHVTTASILNERDTGSLIDLGIAKLHFELGAGNGQWLWGNRSEYRVQ